MADIKITKDLASSKKFNEYLESVQHRCSARTITAADVIDAVAELRNRYEGIALKHWNGCKFVVDWNAQTFPKAYHYTPESTWFEITCKNSNFYISLISRRTTRTKVFSSTLTDDFKAALIARESAF